jgi:multiple sugar transport system permease protein
MSTAEKTRERAAREAAGVAYTAPIRTGGRGRGKRSFSPFATIVLLAGAVYCLLPIVWVVLAASKSPRELFTSFSFAPGTGLIDNLVALSEYGGGQFWIWGANSILYAGVGALLSTLVAAMAGYALAKFSFRGKNVLFTVILAGVLVPGIVLAVPQYLLLAQVGLAGSYWSVLLPSLINPFGIFLCRVFAQAAIPDDLLEAGRLDGASELRLFVTVVLPMMAQGLVTVFLLQFVGIWNNFLLPFIMLSDQDKYPLTLGLYTFLSKGAGDTDLYPLVIMGSAVAIIPLIALVMALQRFWRADLLAGGLKG